jgi:hypothetical protein
MENLPTIPRMCVMWFFMVVLVLERGKPVNYLCNVFPVVLYGRVGSRTRKTCQTSWNVCSLVQRFFMVASVIESGKPANHPWNASSVVLYGCVVLECG